MTIFFTTMRRYLFVRNSLTTDNLFVGVEEYIRNIRGPDDGDQYSRDVSFTSLRYRFPYQLSSHKWKLIRDVNGREDELYIINKAARHFEFRQDTYAWSSINLNELFAALDRPAHPTIAGSAFLGLVNVDGSIHVTDNDVLKCLRLMVKDEEGRMVDWRTGDVLYSDQPNQMTFFLMAAFKMGNLPIYTIILNNNHIINKVLFVNNFKDFSILAENDGVGRLNETILHPVWENGVKVGPNQVFTTSNTITLDLWGKMEWESYNGVQTGGSEIALNCPELPSLNDALTIESSLPYRIVGNGRIEFTTAPCGYVKVFVESGPFFTDCIGDRDAFKYEFIIHKGNP